jgi:prepilin-type N-terminal cleavage/methylation domain-containing protein
MRQLRSHGVTLVELLIVIAILGIAAAVAIPFLSATRPYQVELASSGFANAIEYARSEAMRTGQPYGFTLDVSTQRVRVFRADTSSTPPTPVYDVYNPVSRQLYDVQPGTSQFDALDAVSAAPKYRGNCLDTRNTVFDAHGVAYCNNPGSILLQDLLVTFRLGGLQQQLRLDGVNGMVSMP